MFALKKILVPVDFSERSTAAAEHAAVMAKRFDAELIFQHVVPPGPYEHGFVEGGYNLEGLSLACKAHCRTLAEHGGLPPLFDSPLSSQLLIPPSGFDEFEW